MSTTPKDTFSDPQPGFEFNSSKRGQEKLLDAVDIVGHRILRLKAWRWRTACWVGLAILACVLIAAKRWSGADISTNAIIGVLGAGVFLSFLLQTFVIRNPSPRDIAREIESTHPDLNSALLAAMDQQPDEPGGELRYLQTKVIDKAVHHSTFSSWSNVVPDAKMNQWVFAGLTALVIFLTCSVLAFDRPANAILGPPPLVAKTQASDGTIYGIVVEPGDTEIEKGTSLLVMARFEGQLPSNASVDLLNAEGDTQRFDMAPGVDNDLFLARIPSVDESGTYMVHYDDETTGEFQVSVFTVPSLEQADAHITYPKYANLDGKIVQDTRRISVLEGSSVDWKFQLNKAVASAELRDAEGNVIELEPVDGENVQGATILVRKSLKYTLHLADADGRTNKFPPDITMTAVGNQRPKLKLAFPGKDRAVSPLEEMLVEAKVSDDFGLDSFGITYSLIGQDEQTVKLGEKAKPRVDHSASHMVLLEDMEAEPDQLVSYHFYADDFGPDGELRRTLSDMYFAEVRSFEEIFRQAREQAGGQQQQQRQQGQGQQQSQQGQQLDQLGQLQKQIMTATWNIARRPSLDSRDADGVEQAKKDVEVLSASQETAQQQVQQMMDKIQDAEMQATAVDLVKDMEAAVEQLNGFDLVATADTLKDAMKIEQEAYQKILKLRAREFQVQRQQQQQQQRGQQGQQGNNRRQQQLNQLEMKRQENRYQEQRQAQEQEASVDQEQLRVLNRLRELARRQEAINEKLKQLESELRQAKTEEEREEIERQLKRLRDEQQQMLRDIDETAEEIDKQRDNLNQADQMQRQAQEARDRALNTSEALKKNELSRAVSEGTRTERELKDLRDDFRKETANEFEEVMRQMRREARDVEQQQKEIGDKLAENVKSKSLRYDEQRKEIEKQLQDQQARVTELTDKMRELVSQSEDSEPLLARTLYDEARKLKDAPPEKDLEAERFLVSRGFMEQAMEADKAAKAGIEQLREGIEKSAETVLGDELEGLKRAQEQMDRLQRQLGDELARNAPEQAGDLDNQRQANRQGQNQREGDQQQGGQGQRGDAEQQEGERRQGQGQREGQQQSREGEDRNGREEDGRQRNGQQSEGQQRDDQQRDGQQQGRNGQGQQREGEQQREGQQQGQPGQQGQGQREGEQRQGQNQQGQQQQQGQRDGQGQQPGGNGQGQPRDGQQQQQNQREGQQQGQRGRRPGLANIGRDNGSRDPNGGGAGGNYQFNPLTGEEYRQWSDGLRDIEEMLDDPDMRSDVARIRDRARNVRVDLKRHSKKPQWDLVREEIMQPMLQLQQRLAEEIAKRETKDSMVPIDRDPVPNKYAEMVRRYYERIGRTDDRSEPRASNQARPTGAPDVAPRDVRPPGRRSGAQQ